MPRSTALTPYSVHPSVLAIAKKDRITHRIPITSLADIDDEVRQWLKRTYEMAA
jgi:uncharacterized protein DUF5655